MNYAVEKKVKRRYIVTLVLVLCIMAIGAYTIKITPEVSKVEQTYNDQMQKAEKAKNLNASTESNINAVKSQKKDPCHDLVKSQYIADFGKLAEAHNLSIDKMMNTNPENLTGGDLSVMTFNVELRGKLDDIHNLLESLNNKKYISTVKSISYRLDGQTYLWMYRSIDEQSPITWWDISDYSKESSSENTEENLSELTVDALMEHNIATCYLQIDFVGLVK